MQATLGSVALVVMMGVLACGLCAAATLPSPVQPPAPPLAPMPPAPPAPPLAPMPPVPPPPPLAPAPPIPLPAAVPEKPPPPPPPPPPAPVPPAPPAPPPPPAAGPRVIRIGGQPLDPATHAILIPDSPTPQEQFAAGDLAAILEKMTGKRLPVAPEKDFKGDRTPIVVGRCAATLEKLGVAVDFGALGLEGIAIETKGPALVLAGGKRGVLYAVYTFLEDFCGCRWFTPDCSVIPTTGDLAVEAHVRYVPPLEYRATDYPGSRPADWAVRNKVNGTQTALDEPRGGKVSYAHFVHTFNDILNPDKEFQAHPEYFSEVKGQRLGGRTQLCLTNPQVLRIARETVRRWIRESPGATIFSVSQNDWANFCTCAACKAAADREASQAGPLIEFVNAIADDVAADYPDKVIDTLAYQWSRKPPRTVRPRPNVCVRLCSIECCFAHPLDACDANKSFVDDLGGWNQLCNRLYIWDYVINYAHSVMPFPNFRVLAPNVRFFVAHGVRGLYEEACYFTKGSELAELRTYVLAKTLWNPAADTDRAIDEFLAAYYGAAAGPIRRYFDFLHRQVAEHKDWHVRIYDGPMAPCLGPEFLAQAVNCFDEAEAAVAADPALLERVRTARLPILYVQIMRAGPGDGTAVDAAALVARFEEIARKAGVTMVCEDSRRGRLDVWLKAQRERLKLDAPPPPPPPAPPAPPAAK